MYALSIIKKTMCAIIEVFVMSAERSSPEKNLELITGKEADIKRKQLVICVDLGEVTQPK